MKTLIFILGLSLFSQATLARDWDTVRIPGAVCGDGLPYHVFVDKKKDSKKLLIEFMGGGACWSKETCYGTNGVDFRTWVHPLPKIPAFSYMTSDFWLYSKHPFVNDSAIYIPYCTGDVFAGDHVAYYDPFPVHHTGYRNVLMALTYLQQKNIISFQQMQRVTVWGASAGAIGAFVHLKNIEGYFPETTKKIAIIDSPGLHFGPSFWEKFTPELFNDYKKSFGRINLSIQHDDGFLAPKMGPVFEILSNWTVGVMQSTRDQVMSTVFGDISPSEHRALVLSELGLPAIASRHPYVYTWINDSDMHTFLLLKSTTHLPSMEEQSAMNFVDKVLAIAKRRPL